LARSFSLLACTLVAVALSASSAAAAPAYLGLQVHPLWSTETHAEMLREVELLDEAGVNVARADVGWSSLESNGPGHWEQWYVDKLDAFVEAANARGIKVIATLTETPCWASRAPARLKQGCAGAWWDRGVQDYAPKDPLAYGRAARFLTARYGTRLAALEIWNEPNLSYEFLGTGQRKPAIYAGLVRATYKLAKAGDRRVPVLAGALAGSDVAFLEKLQVAGIKGSYDGISLHPYSDGRPPDSTSAPTHLEFGAGIRSIRASQRKARDVKPLWLTEFGFTACNYDACASLKEQADLISRSVLALRDFPYVRGATVYQLRDTTTDPSSWENNFGMVREDFTRRPAFEAFRSAVAVLRDAR
jgi:hypothetical protein